MPEQVEDPGCGMDIETQRAVASATAEGRRFYFCCLRCQAAFLDTPHRYVGWPGDPARLPAAAVATGRRPGLEPCHFATW
jgi:YHS domain-containing protein